MKREIKKATWVSQSAAQLLRRDSFCYCNWFLSFCNVDKKNLEPVNEQFLGFWLFWWSRICRSNPSSRASFWGLVNLLHPSCTSFPKHHCHFASVTWSVTWLHLDDSAVKSTIQMSDQRVNVIIKDAHLQLGGQNVAFRVAHMFGGVAWEESRDQSFIWYHRRLI